MIKGQLYSGHVLKDMDLAMALWGADVDAKM